MWCINELKTSLRSYVYVIGSVRCHRSVSGRPTYFSLPENNRYLSVNWSYWEQARVYTGCRLLVLVWLSNKCGAWHCVKITSQGNSPLGLYTLSTLDVWSYLLCFLIMCPRPIYSWSSKDEKYSRLFHCSHYRNLSSFTPNLITATL